MKKYLPILLSVLLAISILFGLNFYKVKAIDTPEVTDTLKATGALKVVIYNTHTEGKYYYGESIIEVSKHLRNRLIEKGIDCVNIENNIDPKSYNYKDSFKISKKLITDNVRDYEDCILLDIDMRMSSPIEVFNSIIVLQSEYNKDFINDLMYGTKGVYKFETHVYNSIGNKKNQDLSTKQAYIILCDENTSKEDVNTNIESLAEAISNIK